MESAGPTRAAGRGRLFHGRGDAGTPSGTVQVATGRPIFVDVRSRPKAGFRRQDDAVGDVGGTVGKPSAQQFFRLPASVDIGGVDQVAARFDESVEIAKASVSPVLDPKSMAPRARLETLVPVSASLRYFILRVLHLVM